MADITQILSQIEEGDPSAAEKLLPLVYEELRKLAAARLSHEKPGQTLQATALVHEAYVRLVNYRSGDWDSRGHFFAAAAEAMRRILVDRARAKQSLKRGGKRLRLLLEDVTAVVEESPAEFLDLNDALERFGAEDPAKCELVKLRFFAGLTLDQAAQALDISPATADRYWAYAKAWLRDALSS